MVPVHAAVLPTSSKYVGKLRPASVQITSGNACPQMVCCICVLIPNPMVVNVLLEVREVPWRHRPAGQTKKIRHGDGRCPEIPRRPVRRPGDGQHAHPLLSEHFNASSVGGGFVISIVFVADDDLAVADFCDEVVEAALDFLDHHLELFSDVLLVPPLPPNAH